MIFLEKRTYQLQCAALFVNFITCLFVCVRIYTWPTLHRDQRLTHTYHKMAQKHQHRKNPLTIWFYETTVLFAGNVTL